MASARVVVISQVKAYLSEEVSVFLQENGIADEVIQFIKTKYEVNCTLSKDKGVYVLEGQTESISNAERYIASVVDNAVPRTSTTHPRSNTFPQSKTFKRSALRKISSGSDPDLSSCGERPSYSAADGPPQSVSAPFAPIPYDSSEPVGAKDEAYYCKQTHMLEYIWLYQRHKQWKSVQDILKKHDAEIKHEKKKNDVWITVKGLQKESVDAACSEIYAIFMAKTLGKVTLAVSTGKKFHSADLKAVVEKVSKVFPDVLILQAGHNIDAVGTEDNTTRAMKQIVQHLEDIASKEAEKWLVTPEKTKYTLNPKHGPKVFVYKGGIAEVGVQVVVCPTNSSLASSPGVAGALLKAGGTKYQEEVAECRKRGPLATGKIGITGAGNLPCEKVYQINGPRGNQTEGLTRDLSACFSNCLLTAHKAGVRSIAIPGISAGNNAIPVEIVAASLTEVVISFINQKGRTTPLQQIHLMDRNQSMVDCVATLVEKEVQTCTVNLKKENTTKTSEGENPFDISVSGFTKSERSNDSRHHRVLGTHTVPRPRLSAYTQMPSKVSKSSKMPPRAHTLMHPKLSAPPPPPNKATASSESNISELRRDLAEKLRVSEKNQPLRSPPGEKKEKLVLSGQQQMLISDEEEEEEEEEEVCIICQCQPTNPKTLEKCQHTFCTDCIEQCFKSHKAQCPVCGAVYGVVTGSQPSDGTMKHTVNSSLHLEGYEQHGAIVIEYTFPNGIQTEKHPNPGVAYKGTRRVAYLPDNEQGRKLLGLMKQVFDARLMFTIGRSVTTGCDNVVTWNDIHHKTTPTGGPTRYGYPDPTYLDRLAAELARQGFK